MCRTTGRRAWTTSTACMPAGAISRSATARSGSSRRRSIPRSSAISPHGTGVRSSAAMGYDGPGVAGDSPRVRLALDLADEFVGVGRLDDVVVEAGGTGALEVLRAAVSGEGDQPGAGAGRFGAQGGGDGIAIHAGQADVA